MGWRTGLELQIIYRFRIQGRYAGDLWSFGYLPFPSFQEGLPRAMLEAMASGLPVICSEIRGNTDLMGDSWTLSADRKRKLCPGGIMLSQLQDADVWAEALEDMLSRKNCWKEMGEACIQRSQEFSLDTVEKKMREIYGRFAEME